MIMGHWKWQCPDFPHVILNDKVPFDLHAGGQLSGGGGEVLRRDHELVHLGSVGDCSLVDLLDSCHDLRHHLILTCLDPYQLSVSRKYPFLSLTKTTKLPRTS